MDEPASLNASTGEGSPNDLSSAEQTELLEALNNEHMPELFSTRRPQNIASGFSSGVKTLFKGVGAGVGCLVALPVAGAVNDGAGGFVKGLAAGVAGAVALPVAATCVAGYQMVRGVYNTPEAVVSKAKGRAWDPYERKWVDYRPDQAIVVEKDFNANRTGFYDRLLKGARHDDSDQDGNEAAEDSADDYYNLVGVAKDATAEEIRRSYFKKARQLHPDRNPDDPEADEKFQELGRAYQVLSDPTLRKQYDQHGEEGVQHADLIEPSMFFSMLFGSAKFEPYIGQLALATVTSLGEDYSELAMERAKIDRLVALCKLLAVRLDERAKLGPEAFADKYRAEAKVLLKASFGDRMLLAIADAYKSGGHVAQGGFRGFGSRIRSSTRSFGFKLKAISAAAGAALAQYSVEKDMQKTVSERREHTREVKLRHAMEKTVKMSDVSDEDDLVMVDVVKSGQEAAAGDDGAQSSSTAGAAARGDESLAQSRDTHAVQEEAAVPHNDEGTGHADDGDNDSDEDEDEDDELTPEERAEMERLVTERSMPKALEALWAANLVDIDRTLKAVCRSVTRGDQYGLDRIEPSVRRARADALVHLAEVFESELATYVAQTASAAEQFARAAQATAARGHFGDDVDVDQMHATMAENLREQEADDSSA
eukprot:TRINITY_DN24013_c0_g1_i1.p1 TRINITY_DN24013_c0_g1~~TRINITY_DN24013_c0_g1_i1.p1  ORF type:complete len:653 (+),score=169.65 TRINITY_DN24013_c0_g1_i1:460-2418(+)